MKEQRRHKDSRSQENTTTTLSPVIEKGGAVVARVCYGYYTGYTFQVTKVAILISSLLPFLPSGSVAMNRRYLAWVRVVLPPVSTTRLFPSSPNGCGWAVWWLHLENIFQPPRFVRVSNWRTLHNLRGKVISRSWVQIPVRCVPSDRARWSLKVPTHRQV